MRTPATIACEGLAMYQNAVATHVLKDIPLEVINADYFTYQDYNNSNHDASNHTAVVVGCRCLCCSVTTSIQHYQGCGCKVVEGERKIHKYTHPLIQKVTPPTLEVAGRKGTITVSINGELELNTGARIFDGWRKREPVFVSESSR